MVDTRSGIILKSLSGFYYVEDNESGEVITCRGRGLFRKDGITLLVGDNAKFDVFDDGSGYVTEIDERRNELVRPPIANVDVALVVFAAKEPDFSVKLFDRMLSVIESKFVTPAIVVTKMDLLNEDEIQSLRDVLGYYRSVGYDVFESFDGDGTGAKDVLNFVAGKTVVVCGQSGVGKSTLLNVMDADLGLEVDAISKALGRGKHTTRHVELFKMGDALIADAPGFSALDLDDLDEGDLRESFVDFVKLQDGCRFRGCLHADEPGCAVKEAVKSENVLESRHHNYLQFLDEIRGRKIKY